MNERIKAFLQKVSADADLAAKFNACKTQDEAYAFAVSVDEGIDREEFVCAMEQIKTTIEGSGEITDEDLSKVAGGLDVTDIVITGVISASVSGGLVAAGI